MESVESIKEEKTATPPSEIKSETPGAEPKRKTQADPISVFMFELHQTGEQVAEFDRELRTSVIDSVVVRHNGKFYFSSETEWRLKVMKI